MKWIKWLRARRAARRMKVAMHQIDYPTATGRTARSRLFDPGSNTNWRGD